MPRLKPYSRSACSCSRRDLAEHAADLRAAAEQVRGLAPDDLEVLVFGDVDDAVLGELIELAFDHPQRDVAQQADDVERVLRQRHRHRLDVEEVAEQHRDVVAPPRVHGHAAAAHVGVVDDVVVHERRGVDELDHRGVEHGAIAAVAAQPRGHQQHRRTHALAAALLEVVADFGDEVDPRLDLAGELALDRFADPRGPARTAGSRSAAVRGAAFDTCRRSHHTPTLVSTSGARLMR